MRSTKYREYLNLKPRPEDWEAVDVVARELERELTRPPATNPPPVTSPRTRSVPQAMKPPGNAVAQVAESKPAPITNAIKTPTSAMVATEEVAEVSPPPTIRPAQDVSAPDTDAISESKQAQPAATTSGSGEASAAPKRGFLRRMNPLNLFRRSSRPPSPSNTTAVAASPTAQDTASTSPTAPTFPRYQYRSLSQPVAGDHVAAERAFAQGWRAQQAGLAAEAMQSYRQAVALDPAYFDAYYNLALAATSVGNYSEALTAYETALAVRPDSLDACYNFALVLQKMDYVLDAVSQLEKLLAKYPSESRAHVALGNIYAQQLHEIVKARDHYTKALEINPSIPQAAAIRYWLSANPQ